MSDAPDPLDRRLSQLVHERHDVAPTAPEWDDAVASDVSVTIRSGRAPRRARRLVVAATVTAVTAVAGLVGIPAIRGVDTDRPDPAASQHSSGIPSYAGEDLDTTLPPVARGWRAAMEFSPDAAVNARLYAIWQEAIARCMHDRGYPDHRTVAYPPNADFVDRVSPLDRRYATVMGYHALPADPIDPNTYADDAASASAAGCANDAYESTFGDVRAYFDLNDQLSAGLERAVAGFAESDAGRAASREWSACMAERGHAYTTRDDAASAFSERPTVSEQEIATRLDDLDCDVAVGYTRRQHDFERAGVERWRAMQRQLIDRAVREKQRVEEHLAAVSGGS